MNKITAEQAAELAFVTYCRRQDITSNQYKEEIRPVFQAGYNAALSQSAAQGAGDEYPNEAAVKRMVHDFPILSEFYHKYAIGLKSPVAPSCLCCGRTTKVEDYAVRHAELPGIIICRACKSATETSATPTATASQASREAQMVTLRVDESGNPTVWCDPEIADLVDALNTDKLSTVASCSGHGHRPGRISLKDGRELLVMDSEQVAVVERLFGTDINGQSADDFANAEAQEAVAYGLPNTAITGKKQALMQVRLDIPSNDQYGGALWVPLFLAPPTSTAIAARVIKQAVDICDEHICSTWSQLRAAIAALTPANAEAELEALIATRVNAAVEAFRLAAIHALNEKSEEFKQLANVPVMTDVHDRYIQISNTYSNAALLIEALPGSTKALDEYSEGVGNRVAYRVMTLASQKAFHGSLGGWVRDKERCESDLRELVQSVIRKG